MASQTTSIQTKVLTVQLYFLSCADFICRLVAKAADWVSSKGVYVKCKLHNILRIHLYFVALINVLSILFVCFYFFNKSYNSLTLNIYIYIYSSSRRYSSRPRRSTCFHTDHRYPRETGLSLPVAVGTFLHPPELLRPVLNRHIDRRVEPLAGDCCPHK